MSFSPIKTRFNDSCPVCYNELTKEDTTFNSCKHGICKNCFSKLRTTQCPLCREPIPQKTECLLPMPPTSPVRRNWVRRHPRRRRRRRRWDQRRTESKEESKEEGKEETREREHTNDSNQQKRRAKFPNRNFKGGLRARKYKGDLRR